MLLVAVFSIPSGLSDGGKVVWAYVSYALFSLAYSFVNIPYGSLAAAMTQDPDERAKFSTGRIVAASLTILLIAVVVSPQIAGGGDLQRSLTITTIVFAVDRARALPVVLRHPRETVQRKRGEGQPARDGRDDAPQPAADHPVRARACCSSPACSRCRPSACTTPATCSATPTSTSS